MCDMVILFSRNPVAISSDDLSESRPPLEFTNKHRPVKGQTQDNLARIILS